MGAFWALVTPALWKLLPTFLSIFSGMLIKIFEDAKPLVQAAADNQALPTGAQRHDWVVNQVVPEVNRAAAGIGVALLDPIKIAVANIGVYLAYKAELPKLEAKKADMSGTIPLS